MRQRVIAALASTVILLSTPAAHARVFTLASPDNRLQSELNITPSALELSIISHSDTLLFPSPIALTLADGTIVGPTRGPKIVGRRTVDETIATPLYRADNLRDNFNELTVKLSGDWKIELRAYNDGIAYRYVSSRKKPFKIIDEDAAFRLPQDAIVTTPYTNARDTTSIAAQYRNSFENTYTTLPISAMSRNRLSFLPLAVNLPSAGERLLFSESALDNYPGMYLLASTDEPSTLTADFAPRPKTRVQGGHNNLQMLTTERHDYIAEVDGPRPFPWRMIVVAPDDKTLAATNMTYLLAEPSRIDDTSWIRPGKVAWDWWNDWNITGVPFQSGVNTDTYKTYIDFASRRGIEYVILDEGWAVNGEADLMQVVPEINLPEIVEYADSLGVGIILWAGYLAFDRDMDAVCRHYADMGVKGFKVDFMDHDDQIITDFNYRATETAARHNLILDLHGTSKPAGLNRTWPNVLNFEGVFGLEQMKWAPTSVDMVKNDVMIPFLRQAAGPLDYTQGAMTNAAKGNYRPIYNDPMSQGTRARQVALYMIFDSPLTMMCDTPSNYDREDATTSFIASIPTVWDETRILDGRMGEYIVTARRSGNDWWIGGITDWNARTLPLDLSFIPNLDGSTIETFADGANAHRNGRDFTLTSSTSIPSSIALAPGGGFAIKISPKK